jgi:hypothetical protein
MDRRGGRGDDMSWPDSKEPLWNDVPERVRTEPEPPAPPQAPRRPRRWWLAAAVVLVVALAAWAGWATYAMRENENRATAWQERTKVLQSRTDRLDAVLAQRTKTLNTRVDQLNLLGVRLADAQSALKRSEGDVSSLEVRQRQLADEKAQLEDQARILDGVARSYVICKDDLVALLTDVARNLDATASYDAAQQSCSLADTQLRSYLDAF